MTRALSIALALSLILGLCSLWAAFKLYGHTQALRLQADRVQLDLERLQGLVDSANAVGAAQADTRATARARMAAKAASATEVHPDETRPIGTPAQLQRLRELRALGIESRASAAVLP